MRCDQNARKLLNATLIPGIAGVCLGFSGLLSAQEPKPRMTLDVHTDFVMSLTFSSDGKTLVAGAGGWESWIKIWDVATGREITTLKSEPGAEKTGAAAGGTVAIGPDGKMLASWCVGGKILLWDIASGKVTAEFDQGSDHAYPIIFFSPDSKMLATGGTCVMGMCVWDVATHRNIATFEEHVIENVKAMAFMPDGKSIASMGQDGVVKLWDIASGKNTAVLNTDSVGSPAAFSPDDKTAATGNRHNDDIELWEVATGKKAATLKAPAGDHCWTIIVFSPNATMVAAIDEDKTIQLWDVATRKERATLPGKDVRCTAISPDGNTLASGGEDKTIKLWDISKMAPATP